MENNSSLRQLRYLIKNKVVKLKLTTKNDGIDQAAKFLTHVFNKFSDQTASMVYYLILTSDHKLMTKLADDSVVGYILFDAETLSLPFVLEVVTKMNLLHFVFDIIKWGPVGISSALLEVIEEKQTEVGNTESFSMLKAMLTKILNLMAVEDIESLIGIYKFFQMRMLKTTDLVSKDMDSSSCEGIELSGKVLKEYLSLAHFMLLQRKNPAAVDEREKMYKLDKEYYSDPCARAVTFETILEYLLGNLKVILFRVSCDVWISWEDVTIEDGLNLQQTIGNQIYILLESIGDTLPQDLKQCMQHLGIKPVTEDDEILKASVEDIVVKMTSKAAANEGKWYANLVGRTESWMSAETVQFIILQIHLASDATKVLIKCIDFILSNPADGKVKNSLLSVLSTLSADTQLNFVEEILNRHILHLFEENLNADQEIVAQFNRISSDSSVNDVLKTTTQLVLKFRRKVVTKVFQLAASSKENHNLCTSLLKNWRRLLFYKEKEASQTVLPLILQEILMDCSNKHQQNLNEFLVEFVNDCECEEADEFVAEMLAIVDRCLMAEDMQNCKIVMTSLALIIGSQRREVYVKSVLPLMTQLALKTAWDVWTFNKEKAEVHKICTDIVSNILIYEDIKLDSPLLMHLAYNLPEPARSSFGRLWSIRDVSYPGNEVLHVRLLLNLRMPESVTKYPLNNYQPTYVELVQAFIKVLPVIDSSEWLPLFSICNSFFAETQLLSTFQAFSRSLEAFSASSTPDMYPSFKYCMIGFTELFNSIQSPDLSYDVRLLIFQCLLNPLNRFPSVKIRDSSYFLILPSLVNSIKMSVTDMNSDLAVPFLEMIASEWRIRVESVLNNKLD